LSFNFLCQLHPSFLNKRERSATRSEVTVQRCEQATHSKLWGTATTQHI